MEQEGRATVRTASDAAVCNNTVTGNTVTKSTVRGPNDATVFDSTVPKNILNELTTASQPERTELMENDMKVQCSVMTQQNMVRCKEKAMALLKGEAHLGTRNYKVKASEGIGGVWKLLSAFLDTRAGPKVLNESCLP